MHGLWFEWILGFPLVDMSWFLCLIACAQVVVSSGFFGFSLDWFGNFAMVMGCSLVAFARVVGLAFFGLES